MHLHNTLSGRKEEFTPLNPERVTMYVCGPTVYSFAHIGNARPAVVFDVLARVLRRRYRQVDYTRNITDIDDKINAAAAKEGVEIGVITRRYTDIYHQDLDALGVAFRCLRIKAEADEKAQDDLVPPPTFLRQRTARVRQKH